LQQRREEMLADISLGKATQSDLKKIDVEIDQALRQDSGAVAGHRDAVQTLAGLRKRLAEAEARRDTLREQVPLVLGEYFLAEAERTYAEYLKQAASVAAKMSRLVALEQLYVTYGKKDPSRNHFRYSTWDDAMLPTFHLRSSSEMKSPVGRQGVLFTLDQIFYRGDGGLRDFDRLETHEVEALRKAGLDGLL